ncbi:MAG TPA: CehA/McbA family metallohydrolase [Pirellulaceae bacterium]|nr:CehA/McbA family metallohydrolase [Pirellulaceae bacterium]
MNNCLNWIRSLRGCWLLVAAGILAALGQTCRGADVAILGDETWDEFAPQGKEVDCIYGDFVLRNDQIVAVIAQPLTTRNANMTVRNVGGAIIDLTKRNAQNDQLSAYYPGASKYALHGPQRVIVRVDNREQNLRGLKSASGQRLTWECAAERVPGKPEFTVRYTLADGLPYVVVETIYANTGDKELTEELTDAIRADRTFTFGSDDGLGLFWADDEWFREAYGIQVEGYTIKGSGQRNSVLSIAKEGNGTVPLAPGQNVTIARKIFPGDSLLEVRGIAAKLSGIEAAPLKFTVKDPAGPVANAKITVTQGEMVLGSGRTADDGTLVCNLTFGEHVVKIEALGRPMVALNVKRAADATDNEVEVHLPACGYIVGSVTDGDGKPIPCKVALYSKDKQLAADPDFGPDSAAGSVKNLIYTASGTFRQEIAPGTYEAIVSYGPEYDIAVAEITVEAGKETPLAAKLIRSVDTSGWVSSDFHSHSSPSGDNTSSQLGRVLNLLAEHIEFGPCTEHNRIDTYVPHLKALKAAHLMATCTGMELTGGPLPVNHQNAFPLAHKPRTQDGGAPVTDDNPVVQVERLALWDNSSEKLVQMNHPNLPQILGDKDLDGKPDEGFEKMFGFVDAIEVHPPQLIFGPPGKQADGKLERNPAFHWMQLINLGYRHTGVINTDAHYNFHGSGGYRNYIKSSSDDPAKIDTLEMVHSSQHGHLVMTTGPFLDVKLRPAPADSERAFAIPGDGVVARGRRCTLSIRVQCPNWFDINRVQVFLSGRPAKALNFSRRENGELFKSGVVKFDQTMPLALESDTHIIVAAIGEGLTLGRVMGPQWGSQPPCAVANPIFVDVDGDGFQPNGDQLDLPLVLPPKPATTPR